MSLEESMIKEGTCHCWLKVGKRKIWLLKVVKRLVIFKVGCLSCFMLDYTI